MIALLIFESETILESYADFFKKAGFDTVCYTWLLKALDNVAEIQPALIFMSAVDYPRHWKVLAQYSYSAICRKKPLILLYTGAPLADEEAKKALALEAHCIAADISTSQGQEDLSLFLSEHGYAAKTEGADSTAQTQFETDTAALHEKAELAKTLDEPIGAIGQKQVSANFANKIRFIFDHPRSKSPVLGFVELYRFPYLFFKLSDNTQFEGIRFGEKIGNCTLIEEDGLQSMVKVQVQGIEKNQIEFCIIK